MVSVTRAVAQDRINGVTDADVHTEAYVEVWLRVYDLVKQGVSDIALEQVREEVQNEFLG
jgi:hypothetical protein